MKVQPSVKAICDKCKVIRRHGTIRVICTNPRHKPISFALPRQSDETGEGDQAQIVAVCLQAIWLLA